MTLDKSIESGKERRKPYRGSKAIDPSCRSHGDCPLCRNKRLRRQRLADLKESEGRDEVQANAPAKANVQSDKGA